MSNLPSIMTQGAQLPAHLAALAQSGVAPRQMAVASNLLRTISLKNGQFVVDDNGTPTALPSPLRCIIVDFQSAVGRVFYATKYDPNVKGVTPACWSLDGNAPVDHAPAKQCTLCGPCPQNAKGSASNGQGKACTYSRRVLVWVPGYEEIFQLKLGALSSFAKDDPNRNSFTFENYGKALSSMGVDPMWVWTEFRFNPSQSVAALFTGFGLDQNGQPYVDEQTLAYVTTLRDQHADQIAEARRGDFANTAAQQTVQDGGPPDHVAGQFPASPAAVAQGHPAAAYANAPQFAPGHAPGAPQAQPGMPAPQAQPQFSNPAVAAAMQQMGGQQGGQYAQSQSQSQSQPQPQPEPEPPVQQGFAPPPQQQGGASGYSTSPDAIPDAPPPAQPQVQPQIQQGVPMPPQVQQQAPAQQAPAQQAPAQQAPAQQALAQPAAGSAIGDVIARMRDNLGGMVQGGTPSA